MAEIKVGLVDSGTAAMTGHPAKGVVTEAAFVVEKSTVDADSLWQTEATADVMGHGTAVAQILHQLAPEASLLSAQVFHGQAKSTTAWQVAAAIDWLVAEGAQLINLSLGLLQDRPLLRQACEQALAAGVILVASSPARGEPVYPAAYRGVIRASGDARCKASEWSYLGSRYADVGGCVQAPDGLNGAGASIGCAYISGHIAAFMGRGNGADEVRGYLRDGACYLGVERRF